MSSFVFSELWQANLAGLKALGETHYGKEVSATDRKREEEKRRTLNMKSRTALSVEFVLIAATAFAADAPVAQSDAQKSFTTMKSLAREGGCPVTVPEK